MLRRPAIALAASCVALASLPVAASAAGSRCARLPASISLRTADPTAFADEPVVVVRATGGAQLSDVRVELRRGRRVDAVGSRAGALPSGAVSVPVTVARGATAGAVRLVATARQAGCARRTSAVRALTFTAASLPVRAAPSDDRAGGVSLVVRTVAGRSVRGLTATLVDASGATVAHAGRDAPFSGPVALSLPVTAALPAGRYAVRLKGRTADGVVASSEQPLVLAAGSAPADPPSTVPTSGLARQNVVVDWSGGASAGRETAGFVAPGIGYGEIVCRPNAQWIRFFPTDLGAEVSMMNWTYRDWSEGREKALREALHTRFTGPDFREGLNKFSPAEKHATGQFDGVIAERGPIGGPGSSGAAPTTLKLTWAWDFSDPARARCHVEATFSSERPSAARPLARSASVIWRGEVNAPGRQAASTDVPGVGNLRIACEPRDGRRTLTLDTPQGGTVITREGSDDAAVPQPVGPLTAQLPNSGQIAMTLADGSTLLASSRWKVNDPDPAQNSCAVTAQVVSP